jgi:hypothetical protein
VPSDIENYVFVLLVYVTILNMFNGVSEYRRRSVAREMVSVRLVLQQQFVENPFFYTGRNQVEV